MSAPFLEARRRGMPRRLAAAFFAAVVALPAAAQQRPADPGADVLSIGGSVTEIVVALGQEERLRARDATSTYPPRVRSLPDVGYMRALSPEGVLSVGAGLILAQEGAGPPATLDVIRAAGVTYVEAPDARDAEGVSRKIEIVGEALGARERAAELAAEVREALDKAVAEAAVRAGDEPKRVLFVLSTQGGRIMAAGAGTPAETMITMAGGVNAAAGFQGYKPISDEAVGQAAPDVLLIMEDAGGRVADDDALFAMPAIQLTPAGRDRSAIRIDGLLLLGFGPRIAEAVQTLSGALYGDAG